MAATQRAQNKHWTLFRCSDAYAIFRGCKTLNCACCSLIWQPKFELSTILQHYIRAYQIWLRYLSWLVSHCWFCRHWLNINHWLEIFSIHCVFTPVFGLFWVGGRFWWHYWQYKCETFWQVFVVWFLLISFLFLEYVCNPKLVDDYVRLFLSFCVCYGMSTKKIPKNLQPKRGKGDVKQLSSKTLKLFQSAQLEVLDWKVWFSQKPVKRRMGTIYQVQ